MESEISKNFLVKRLVTIFQNQKLFYIIISGLISILGFIKSFLFLKFFDFAALGLINICQNFIISISLLQIGFVTGGYRIFCYKSGSIVGKINSAVLYFFCLLFLILCMSFLIAKIFFGFQISYYFLFFYIITGILSLYANWVTCKLLAVNKINLLNKANIISVLISLSILFLYEYIGVWAALSTFLTQPLILITFAYINVPAIVPQLKQLNFLKFGKKIISLGFVPYLTSALGYFNSQVGRWLITFNLGTIILGKTSLVNLYITLINVFPSAMSNLFFPALILKYETGKYTEFKSSLNRYFLVLLLYLSVTILFTVLFSNVTVKLLFPKHLESLTLVYAILPSLTFLCLSGPIIIVLNATKNFKAIFYGSLISSLVYICTLIIYLYLFKAKLIGFFLIESFSSFCFFAYNCYVFKYIILKKSYE